MPERGGFYAAYGKRVVAVGYPHHITQKGNYGQDIFIDDSDRKQYLTWIDSYIERNPVRANLVAKPWGWKWSSASVHVGTNEPHRIKLKDFLGLIDMPPDAWKFFIDIPENARDIESIRKFTLNGRPLGGEQFIESLENRFRKKLHALPRGRPLVGNR